MNVEFIKFLKDVKTWDDLHDSLKFKSSGRTCNYTFKKGKKEGDKCTTNIDDAYPENNYCCKHTKYNN